MIRAVIFDCFGVLTTDGWLAFKQRYFADGSDQLAQAMAANKQVDAGLISYQDFLAIISELAGTSLKETIATIESNMPNQEVFDFIQQELAGTYKIGLLSNAGANWLDKLFTPQQNAFFDAIALSYEVGTIKPDPLMYNTIATRLDLLPEECVYVDDQPRFAIGAAEIGMKAVHYENAQQAIEQIRKELHA